MHIYKTTLNNFSVFLCCKCFEKKNKQTTNQQHQQRLEEAKNKKPVSLAGIFLKIFTNI